MTSLEVQTLTCPARRTRTFSAWLAILKDSAAWFPAIRAQPVSRYLCTSQESVEPMKPPELDFAPWLLKARDKSPLAIQDSAETHRRRVPALEG